MDIFRPTIDLVRQFLREEQKGVKNQKSFLKNISIIFPRKTIPQWKLSTLFRFRK